MFSLKSIDEISLFCKVALLYISIYIIVILRGGGVVPREAHNLEAPVQFGSPQCKPDRFDTKNYSDMSGWFLVYAHGKK